MMLPHNYHFVLADEFDHF